MTRWIIVASLCLAGMFGVATSPAWADEGSQNASLGKVVEQLVDRSPRQRDAEHVTTPAPREVVDGVEALLRRWGVMGR